MSEKLVLHLDKPHFEVKLHPELLEVDLKEGFRGELEKLAEARPLLRDTLGFMFQTIIPLDLHLYQIEKVAMEDNGRVNIRIPHRRDVHIPLDPTEAKLLCQKLDELIPIAKQKAIERELAEKAALQEKERHEVEGLKYRRPGV